MCIRQQKNFEKVTLSAHGRVSVSCITCKNDALFVHKFRSASFIGSVVGQPIVAEDLDLAGGNSLLEEPLKVFFGWRLDLAGRKLFLGQCPVAEEEADTVVVEGEHADCMQVATID